MPMVLESETRFPTTEEQLHASVSSFNLAKAPADCNSQKKAATTGLVHGLQFTVSHAVPFGNQE